MDKTKLSFKRILSFALSLAIAFSVIAGLDINAYAQTDGFFRYNISDEKATILYVDDSISGDVVVPSTLGGYPVTRIGNSSFERCEGLISLQLPNSVVSIGDYAFNYCIGLVSISIGENLTTVGEFAFRGCENLISIDLPDSVTSIGYQAFSACKRLESAKLPRNVTYMGNAVFYDCYKLSTVTPPKGITSIGGSSFFYCKKLTTIKIPDGVTSINGSAFYCCTGLTSILIPRSISVIKDEAFYNCSALKDVYFTGTESEWNSISIGSGNTYLTNTTIHYNVNVCDIFGHTEVIDEETSPTCTKAGLSIGTHCSVCNEIIIPQEEISPALGHTVVIDPPVEATASHTGLTEGSHCSICGGIIVKQEIIPKINHNYTSEITRQSTCTKEGVRKYTCENCGDSYTEKIAKKPHTYGNYKVTKKATTKANGSLSCKCTACGKNSAQTISKIKSVKLKNASYVYNGKIRKPAVIVKDAKGKTISRKYYTVKYSAVRKNIGKYDVRIIFKTRYSGTAARTFTIEPKSTSIKSITPVTKGFTLKWSKVSNIGAYQIQYSTSPTFEYDYTSTLSGVSPSKTTQTIKGLKGKKKYYVRIRTYKNAKYRGKPMSVPSAWSQVKTVKTK